VKTKYSGNDIHSAEQEKYEQTTVTFKKSQVEKKAPQGTMNSSSLIYLQTNRDNSAKRENLNGKKGQPCRLSD